MSLNFGTITITSGVSAGQATNVSQMNTAISTAVAAIPSSTRGSVYQTAVGAGQPLTAATYTTLNGTFSSLYLNNLTVAGNAFTNTASGTSYLQVTASVSLTTSVIALITDTTLAICVNGTPIATTIASLAPTVEEIMSISCMVSVGTGDVVTLQVQVAGTGATMTNRGMTLTLKG